MSSLTGPYHVSFLRMNSDSNHKRVLTEQMAVDIYKIKLTSAKSVNSHGRFQSQSRIVAEKYGVSPKTVRDIWDRKTWALATEHLLSAEGTHGMSSNSSSEVLTKRSIFYSLYIA